MEWRPFSSDKSQRMNTDPELNASSPISQRLDTVWEVDLLTRWSSTRWSKGDNSSSGNSAAQAPGSLDLKYSGALVALMTVLLLMGQLQAASTSEMLLFESVGEMVVGLSYSHTVLSMPLTDLEKQVQDYKNALLREFNKEAIDNKVAYQVITQSQEIGAGNIDTVRDNWLSVVAIHLDEVERLEKRIARLFEILSPSKSTSPNDQTVFNFCEPYDPNSDAEWIDFSDRLRRKED
jgi:hypothetical protein